MEHLEIVSLSKTYHTGSFVAGKKDDVQALKEVSFTLGPGFYGLLGLNGVGKSTLMNIIMGTLRQDKGYVLWNGKSTFKLGRSFRKELGYMPQQQNLYDKYTSIRFWCYALLNVYIEIANNGIGEDVLVNNQQNYSNRGSATSGTIYGNSSWTPSYSLDSYSYITATRFYVQLDIQRGIYDDYLVYIVEDPDSGPFDIEIHLLLRTKHLGNSGDYNGAQCYWYSDGGTISDKDIWTFYGESE